MSSGPAFRDSARRTDQGTRYTIGLLPRTEILDRLRELNHQKYADEIALGLHKKPKQHPEGRRMETETTRGASSRVSAAGVPVDPPTKSLVVQLSSTRRGARLARLFTAQHLAEWGVPYGGQLSDAAALVASELATNAVHHCGGAGRDFRLGVLLGSAVGVRIEVTDACADRPLPPGPLTPSDDLTCGHGLLLVDAVATRWGSTYNDLVTKTVWVELGAG